MWICLRYGLDSLWYFMVSYGIFRYVVTLYTAICWSDPPTNSGIMDFNCNFSAKLASIQIFLMLNRSMKSLWGQPTWNQIKSIQLEFAEILLDKIPFGQRERQQCRDEFAKGQILLNDKFC